MKALTFAFIIIIFALFQAAILYHADIFNAKPDLLLISMLMASLFFEFRTAIILSIFAGMTKDIFSANASLSASLFPLWSLLIIKLSKKIPLDNIYIRMALIFIIANLNGIAGILIYLFLGNFIYGGIFLRILFFGALYTAFVFPLALRAIEPLFAMLKTPLSPQIL